MATFYAARSATITPLPWPTFALPFSVDSVDAMFNFVRYNAGVSILPSHLAEQGVASGELVQLLPNWKPRPLGIFAVWPDTSRRENLTLLFVRFLAEHNLC